jgi:hypothetical protein
MPYGIMPDSARQEGSATTYGLINTVPDEPAQGVGGVVGAGHVTGSTPIPRLNVKLASSAAAGSEKTIPKNIE